MEYLASFLLNLASWVVAICKWVFVFFLELFYGLIDAILLPVAEALPDMSSYWSGFSTYEAYFYFANKFVAFNVGATLLAVYLGFLSLMIFVKLFVKLFIPTVG